MNACEDFFGVIFKSFITSAAMEILNMGSVDEWPDNTAEESWLQDRQEREQLMDMVLSRITDKFINIQFHSPHISSEDRVLEYAKELISVGSLSAEFADAIKQGDGERVIRCWRYLMVIFHNSNRKNYAKEAVLLLHQHQYLLSPQLSERLMYDRFINVRGMHGSNISADLHMEHLNRILKNGIESLASNKNEKPILTLGKAIGTIGPVLSNFDTINDVDHHKTRHKPDAMKKEILKVTSCIHKLKLFHSTPGRQFPTFPNPRSLVHKSSKDKLNTWIETHLSK